MRQKQPIITASNAVIAMWIYDDHNWPNFSWNADKLTSKLADIRFRQGKLLGQIEGFGFNLQQEASLNMLTNDVVKSSAIEGEKLASEEVRSSIARRLGIDLHSTVPVSKDVDGIVEMMLNATQGFTKKLTKDRLFDWHAALFPTGRSGIHRITVGEWRAIESDPMQVISGSFGHEKIHYQAPSADRIGVEIDKFLKWFESKSDLDQVIKAGIAHLWFITIHPFEDGNGRIARAIGDMALARADGTPDRFYSLSTQIEAERKQYYNQLEKQQRGTTDITSWLEWFLDCLGRAISNAEKTLSNVIYKAQLWDYINQYPVNERQKYIINRMLEGDFKGFMNTSKYAKLAKCSNDTALRDINDLKSKKIFLQNQSGGRSTSYRLKD